MTNIPNIIHFIFGFLNQVQPFPFVYYVAVWSAYVINHPDVIYFHYHNRPYGPWFERLIPIIKLVHIETPPSKVGQYNITDYTHITDVYKMNVLLTIGGVYMDIDTISVNPYTPLLHHDCVLGEERINGKIQGFTNSIIMSSPSSVFMNSWMSHYLSVFNPHEWKESSILLPYLLYKNSDTFDNKVTILSYRSFCYPSFDKCENIFINDYDSNDIYINDIITLHLCNTNTITKDHIRSIENFSWMIDHPNTLYSILLRRILDKDPSVLNDNNLKNTEIVLFQTDNNQKINDDNVLHYYSESSNKKQNTRFCSLTNEQSCSIVSMMSASTVKRCRYHKRWQLEMEREYTKQKEIELKISEERTTQLRLRLETIQRLSSLDIDDENYIIHNKKR